MSFQKSHHFLSFFMRGILPLVISFHSKGYLFLFQCHLLLLDLQLCFSSSTMDLSSSIFSSAFFLRRADKIFIILIFMFFLQYHQKSSLTAFDIFSCLDFSTIFGSSSNSLTCSVYSS
jgi:hypothetical protein